LLVRNFDDQPTQAELSQARADAIAAIPQLPKDTEEKLSAALHPELTPITADFVDPLIDRFGVDRGPQTNAARSTSFTALPTSTPLLPTTPDKVARLSQWQQAVRNANTSGSPAPSITTAYLISELSPAGRIFTSGAQAAWLYIESEKRQIAANVGAKFYDGILVGMDRQGVVFRTSTGETKLIQWDHQEEFSARPSTPPSSDRPKEKTKPRPSSETGNPAETLPRALTSPTRHNDYSDLQIAVRDRYANTKTPKAASTVTKIDSSPDQAPTPVLRTSSTPTLTIPNPFSTASGRSNKFEYAHAPQTRSRSTLNFHTTSIPPIFNFDDPTSFATEASTETPIPLSQPKTTEEPASSPKPTPALAEESTGPPALSSQPESRKTLCDSAYHGENITITNESNRPLSLLTLVNRLNEAYGANLVLDYDVQEIPVRLTITNAPWTSILRTLLDLNDLDMVCLDGGIVQIAKRTKIASMGELRRRNAPIVREVFRLEYLQQTAGARANLAGQTQASNGATIQ